MLNGQVRVTILPNGQVHVDEGSTAATWGPRMVAKAIELSKECAALRQVYWPIGAENCPCLACEVAKVAVREERYQ